MIGLLPETGLDTRGELILPPGKCKGLLRRDDYPGQYCGFFREIQGIDVIPMAEWDQWIEEGTSLKPNSQDSHYDQNGFGSCGSEGICGGVETMRSVQGLEPVLFNPLGMYYETSGGRDNGSTLSANLRHAREKGCFPASVWPRSKGFRSKPSAEAYEAALKYRVDEFYEIESWEEYGSALLQRFAVYSGYSGHAWFAVRLVNR